MAEEAGRKAAMYVMRSYPKLFPAYKRVPVKFSSYFFCMLYVYLKDYQRPKRIKGCNENSLKGNIDMFILCYVYLTRVNKITQDWSCYETVLKIEREWYNWKVYCIIYTKEGNPVSLEVQNMLLALLSHYGVGNSGSSQQSLTINGKLYSFIYIVTLFWYRRGHGRVDW